MQEYRLALFEEKEIRRQWCKHDWYFSIVDVIEILVEKKEKKILVDSGNLKYKEEYFDIWNQVDMILITHKHPDHCNNEVLEKLNKNITIYSTKEVQEANQNLDINIVKENDVIELDDIKIEVVHAVHGYQPLLKGAKEIHENVGYIIDDGKNTNQFIWITQYFHQI